MMTSIDYILGAIADAGRKLRLNSLIQRVEGVSAFDSYDRSRPLAVVSMRARTFRDSSALPGCGRGHVAFVKATIRTRDNGVFVVERPGAGNTREQAVRRAVEAIEQRVSERPHIASAVEVRE